MSEVYQTPKSPPDESSSLHEQPSDTTLISSVLKIQASIRGFLLRRRLLASLLQGKSDNMSILDSMTARIPPQTEVQKFASVQFGQTQIPQRSTAFIVLALPLAIAVKKEQFALDFLENSQ
ncbi:hypothetical protein GEMRC1_010255 [Eukaryota sp. GEM-RC1]